MEPNEREGVIILGRDGVEFCQILQQRFNYLTDLRTMTAHRHITLIGVVGAFMAGVFQFGGQEGQGLIARLLLPASIVLLLLGACVTIYDAMIRHRARAVMAEISRVLDASGMHIKKGHKHGFIPGLFRVFDEDFFFFSQILIVNGLTAVPLVMRVNRSGAPKITFGMEGYFVYIGAVVFFGCLWFITLRAYDRWGPANNWFPQA